MRIKGKRSPTLLKEFRVMEERYLPKVLTVKTWGGVESGG
jgi:hypothetical protein